MSCPKSSSLFSLSSFYFLINPTLECYWECTTGHQESVCEEAALKATPETLSYPRQLLLNPPPPLIPPRRKQPRKRWFQFYLYGKSAEGVRLIAAPFLSTWTRTKVGSLRLSMILACGSLHQLVSALGGKRVWRARGRRHSDRHPIYTADASDWQV